VRGVSITTAICSKPLILVLAQLGLAVFFWIKHMAWIEIDLMDKSKIPIVSCCYAIYFDGEMVYIGSTNNLRNRFSGHAFRYGYGKNIITPFQEVPYDTKITIKYKPIKKYGYWLMLEARLIRRLQPLFNKKLKKAIHHG
jgi:excinuclease UvrABC nuclease subunit